MRVVKLLWLLSMVWLVWTACRVRVTVPWAGYHTRGVWVEDRMFGKKVTLTAHQQKGATGYTAAGVYFADMAIDEGYYVGVFHEDWMVMSQHPGRPGSVKQEKWVRLFQWR